MSEADGSGLQAHVVPGTASCFITMVSILSTTGVEAVHIMSSSLGSKPENLVPPDMHGGAGILLTPHVPGSAGIELRNRNK